ncbi:MAG: DUF2723 domain-containing protein [Chloroflexota bacterium]|nr:DUF2723 domain-containing protein [Chloroflexota bacterium]
MPDRARLVYDVTMWLYISSVPVLSRAGVMLLPGRRHLRLTPPLIAGVVLALLALGLYGYTLAPSVMPGDYAEFQLSAAVLGVPHPTGYPLYVMLGKLFTLLPFGDVAYRVNLSSAVYMAGAVAVLYALGVKLLRTIGLTRYWWAAIVGAAFFSIAPTVWSMSLLARSYALNALLVGSVTLCLVIWRQSGKPRFFYASCLLIGLSLVHHGTTYLLLPAYGLYLLVAELRLRGAPADKHGGKRRLLGFLCLLLGLSPLLFLVYRFLGGSPYYWGNPTAWKDFFSLLTGGPFQNQVLGFGADPASQAGRALFGLGQLYNQFTFVGIAVGLLGLVVLWRAARSEAALFTLMMLGNFWFAMNYALVGYLYFIPTYLLWALCMAVGVGWLGRAVLEWIGAGLPLRTRAMGLGAISLALSALFLSSIAVRYPNIDQSSYTGTRDRALSLLGTVPQGASIYMDWEDISVIRFYRLVYGLRTDLTLHTGDPTDWAKAIYCDLNSGVAAYVGTFAGAQPPQVARDFMLEPASMGWRTVKVLDARRYAVPPCGTCATCR